MGDARQPHPPGLHQRRYALVPEGGKTLVRVTDSGSTDDAVADHIQGWDHYLTRLAVVAAGGDAGPDRKPGA